MVMILEDGVNCHRIEDTGGNQVGSIRNGTIRLRGLASKADAIVAAMIVWETLDAVLVREFAGWPRHRAVLDRLRVVHDGAYDWIADGRKPLARLLRMPMDDASDDTFAIEFVLPSYASEGVAISAAQIMANVLDDYMRHRDGLSNERDAAATSGSTAESLVPRPPSGEPQHCLSAQGGELVTATRKQPPFRLSSAWRPHGDNGDGAA